MGTIGPATNSVEMMCEMIHAGMSVARLNYSHGDFAQHDEVVKKLRQAEVQTVQGTEIDCKVLAGEEIRSNKGIILVERR